MFFGSSLSMKELYGKRNVRVSHAITETKYTENRLINSSIVDRFVLSSEAFISTILIQTDEIARIVLLFTKHPTCVHWVKHYVDRQHALGHSGLVMCLIPLIWPSSDK